MRGRLFLSSVALLFSFATVSGVWLSGQLDQLLLDRTQRRLVAGARMGCQVMNADAEADPPKMAWQLAEASELRFTLIADDGTVLGDSAVPHDALHSFENHGTRPEVQQAQATVVGVDRHVSSVTGLDTMYVAIACDIEGRPGTVRAAAALTDIKRQNRRLMRMLLYAGLIGLGVAGALSALASHLAGRPFQRLLDRVRTLPESRLDADARVTVDTASSELERVVSALASERDSSKTMLGALSEGVIALDTRGHVSAMNDAARSLLHEEGEKLGQPVTQLLGGTLAGLASAALGGQMMRSELVSPTIVAGARRVLALRAVPIASGGCVMVVRDITEARNLDKLRQAFVADASHELRTPVSAMLTSVEALESGGLEDPEVARRLLGAVKRNANRTSALIADLISLSQLDAGERPLRREEVDVTALAWQVRENLWEKARDRNQVLELESQAGTVAMGDPIAVEQILTNLVHNAIKYAHVGGHIILSVTPADELVRVEVRDDGPGVPSAHRKQLFQRFYRVDTGRSSTTGGTGLGLAIVKSLVESMGGDVGMEPNRPTGAVFWVELPRA